MEIAIVQTIENQTFLEILFEHHKDDFCPVLASFEGHPHTVPRSCWAGVPWMGDGISWNDRENNYFSLATFRPDGMGKYRRRKSQFVSLHVVVLDDVGTKVPSDQLLLPPTWRLETSSGNFQVGYALTTPVIDPVLADRVMDAVVEAGLCDPGAKGPCTRLARLPVGANGKHDPPFACRLVEWNPHIRYTVEDLVCGLGLELIEAPRRRKSFPWPSPHPEEMDPIFIPRAIENAVLVALRSRGLYIAPQTEGLHSVLCPWVDQHTGGDSSGTAYFEPTVFWPIGGFKCHHGHCNEHGIHDLLSFLGVEPAAARMTSTIRVVPGELDHIVDAAERELASCGRFFQRGGLVVSVHVDPSTHEARVEETSPLALQRTLAGIARWERFDARTGRWVRTDPPSKHALVLHDATSYPHLPILHGVARQPYLRQDGALVSAPGYDPGSGLFGVFQLGEFDIPDSPAPKQAEQAHAFLKEALREFSFAAPVDHAAALAACLTAAIRPSLALAPMFHVRSHQVGSGKSYLCELISAFAAPNRTTPTAFPCEDKECSKLLLAELMRGPATIVFDNLTGDLVPHKSLCTALTSEFLLGRILGISKTVSVGTRVLVLSSGNNVGPVRDMTRRCVTIRLSPECEVPAARSFSRPDLLREVLAERGRYVSAALTIIRAWIAAGRPKAPCRVLAGFGDWSELCCQPLLWLGEVDPTASVFEAMAEDPDQEVLHRLLVAWQSVFGPTEAMVRDALKPADGHEDRQELLEVVQEIAGDRGEINRKKLGWWIRRHAGRIVGGKRMVPSRSSSTAERWRVESLSAVSLVSPVCMSA